MANKLSTKSKYRVRVEYKVESDKTSQIKLNVLRMIFENFEKQTNSKSCV